MCEPCDFPGLWFGEHWMLSDAYGWHWCGCGWYYFTGYGTIAEESDAVASFMGHLAFRDLEKDLEGADEQWELYDTYYEFGMAEDIHAGDRNFVTDPPFWPKFEHPTDWKCTGFYYYWRPAESEELFPKGPAVLVDGRPVVRFLERDTSAGRVYQISPEEEMEALSW